MNTIQYKRALARLWTLNPPGRPRRVILYFHAIGEGPKATPQSLFHRQMEWLAAHAEVLSLDELLSGVGETLLRATITFDDGYASVAAEAEPVLRALNLPATVYLNTGWIGEGDRRASDPELGHYPGEHFMSWEDVELLARRRWIIGSHGVEHLDLTTVDDARLAVELRDSKRLIADRLGTECRHFAYTWGRYTRRVQRAVADAGYQTAVSAIHGPVKPTSGRFALPRIDISNQYSLEDFRAIVRGHWDFLGGIQRVRRVVQGLA